MVKKKPVIFCDFDGTLMEKDIGHALFTHFSGGRNLPLVEQWKNMEISSRECLRAEAELLININIDDIYKFLDQFEPRSGFPEFYERIRADEIPLYVVSDGADIYIKYLLKKSEFKEIPFFSNRVRIENGRYIMEFPYDNNGCIRCGSCKGARIREIINNSPEKYEIYYIGDGLSDICAVPHADIIFARGDFLDYCRNNNFKAVEYADFFDILGYLKNAAVIL